MDFLNWLPLLGLGGIGIAIYVLGGVAVLGTLNGILNVVSPILTGAKEFLSWYFSNLWDGIKVVTANASTFLVIATIAAFTGYATMHQTKKVEVAKCTTKVQKLSKKTNKKSSSRLEKTRDWYDPFGVL